MARIHLIVGPVGAGKSTFARELARQYNAVPFNLDQWMADLFRQDRPETNTLEWYIERTHRCVDQIWRITEDVIATGTDVVLEIGLILRRDRETLYARVDAQAYDLTIYVLDAPREIRRERVMRRNEERGETFAMEVPPHFFELASDLWEPLTDVEREGRDVRVVDSAARAL
ncbi:MAG TPA: AAA family ATPase [Thermoanaerobaculia bacterium]|jgi:predicted kinase